MLYLNITLYTQNEINSTNSSEFFQNSELSVFNSLIHLALFVPVMEQSQQ